MRGFSLGFFEVLVNLLEVLEVVFLFWCVLFDLEEDVVNVFDKIECFLFLEEYFLLLGLMFECIFEVELRGVLFLFGCFLCLRSCLWWFV